MKENYKLLFQKKRDLFKIKNQKQKNQYKMKEKSRIQFCKLANKIKEDYNKRNAIVIQEILHKEDIINK